MFGSACGLFFSVSLMAYRRSNLGASGATIPIGSIFRGSGTPTMPMRSRTCCQLDTFHVLFSFSSSILLL